MAIGFRAAGAWSWATTNTQSPAIPAAQVTGDLMVCFYQTKPYSDSPTINQSWNSLGPYTSGTNAAGVDNGSMQVRIFWKIAVSDTETDPTITNTTNNLSGAVIAVFSKASTENWETPVARGGFDNTGTGISITVESDPGIISGDYVVYGVGFNTDAATPESARDITTTGVTYGTDTIATTGTAEDTGGGDGGGFFYYVPASSGTSSAAPVITATAGTATLESAGIMARLRVTPVAVMSAPGSITVSQGAVTASGVQSPTVNLSAQSITVSQGTVTADGGGAGGYDYELLDEFTTDDASPVASPRTAEPGSGELNFVQNDGTFAIASGGLDFTAQTTVNWPDLGFYGTVGGSGLARAAGRALMSDIEVDTDNKQHLFAWQDSAATADYNTSAHTLLFPPASSFPTQSIWALANAAETRLYEPIWNPPGTFQVALVLRAEGCFFLIKGGVYTEWTLVYPGYGLTTTPLWPAFSNADQSGTLDNFRVVNLPAPWDSATGLATSALAGARAVNDTFTHEPDAFVEFVPTAVPSAGNAEVRFRVQDASNYWFARVTSAGDLGLYEVVGGGGATQRANVTGVVVGATPVIVGFEGTRISCYYDNAARWNYTSASNFQTETDAELASLGTGGSISDIRAWPRVLSGTAVDTLDGAGGSPDGTATPTSQSITVSQVAVTASGDASVAVTVQSITASQGTLPASGAGTATLAAQSITASQGTVTAAGDASTAPASQSITINQGAVSASAGTNAEATTTSQSITVSQGTLTASGDASTTLTVQSVTVQQGAATASGAAGATITAQSLTVSQSATTATGTASVDIAAQSITISQGAVSASGAGVGEVTIATQSVTVQQGAVTASGVQSPTVALSVQSVAAQQGSVTAAGMADVTLSTQTLAVQQGGLIASGGSSVSVSITTQSVAVTQGSLVVAGDAVWALASQSVTVEQGAVGYTLGATATIAAQSITITQGTLSVIGSFQPGTVSGGVAAQGSVGGGALALGSVGAGAVAVGSVGGEIEG
jgi:hypothetical protein